MVSGIYRATGERVRNEDSVAFERVRTNKGMCILLVVADGIGSMDVGQTASGYIVECIVGWFYSYAIYHGGCAKTKLKRSIQRTVYDCKQNLRTEAKKNGLKMGSTCTMVCLWGKRYMCMHVGDSGAYFIRKKRKVFGHGSTYVQKITETHRDDEGRLCRCIGSIKSKDAQIEFGRIRRHTGVLVATDGFLEKITETEMTEMFNFGIEIDSEGVDRRLSAIGREIAARGGKDNRSAVFYMA